MTSNFISKGSLGLLYCELMAGKVEAGRSVRKKLQKSRCEMTTPIGGREEPKNFLIEAGAVASLGEPAPAKRQAIWMPVESDTPLQSSSPLMPWNK